MDLRQLKYFVTIAERGSFSAAAQTLHIAQSALSRHVKMLELEFGATLLERGTRGVKVNEAGEVLLERARIILRDVENLHAEISTQNKELTGVVRFAAAPSVAELLFAPIAHHFSKSHPRVTLVLKEALSEQAIDDLLAGALDMAIVASVSSAKTNDLLRFIPKITDQAYVFGPPKAPDLSGKPLPKEQVRTLKLVYTPEITAALGAPAPTEGYIQTNSIDTLKNLVKAGLGYSVLPYSSLHEDLKAGKISALAIRDMTRPRMLALPVRRILSRAAQELIRVMDEEIARLVKAGRLLPTQVK